VKGDKGLVKLFLSTLWRYTRGGELTFHHLNLSARWRWRVSFTPPLFYSRGGGGGGLYPLITWKVPEQGTGSKNNKLCRPIKFLKLLSFGMSQVVVQCKKLLTFCANNQLAHSIKSSFPASKIILSLVSHHFIHKSFHYPEHLELIPNIISCVATLHVSTAHSNV
jgi:hypothetical protein